MKIGVQFFVTGYTVDPVTLAQAAEEAGFESFWVPDHAIMPSETTTPYGMTGGVVPDVYSQMADPFVLLGVMAGATTTLKLATGICVVPERHPLILAKAVSTLDNFSGGRLLFGIGTGWMREEIELFGVDFDTRWKYTRESVEFMKALWRDGEAGYDGELVRFPSVICDPLPAQRPHPPVILGVQPTPLGLRRIARWGDGWFATGATPEVIAHARSTLAEECDKIGRDPSEIEISVGVRNPSTEYQRMYEDAGADRLVVGLYNHTGEALPMQEWAAATVTANSSPPQKPEETLEALEKMRDLAEL